MRNVLRKLLASVLIVVAIGAAPGCILYNNSSLGQVDSIGFTTARFTMNPTYSHLLVNVFSDCHADMGCFSTTVANNISGDSIGTAAVWDCVPGVYGPVCGASIPQAIEGLAFTQPSDDQAYRCLSFDAGLNGLSVQFIGGSWRWWRPSNNGPNGGCPASLVGASPNHPAVASSSNSHPSLQAGGQSTSHFVLGSDRVPVRS